MFSNAAYVQDRVRAMLAEIAEHRQDPDFKDFLASRRPEAEALSAEAARLGVKVDKDLDKLDVRPPPIRCSWVCAPA